MLACLALLASLALQDPAPKPILHGLVKGPDGKALAVPASVTLSLQGTDGSYRQQKARSSSDGSFTLELEPGWKVVELWGRARGYGQGHAASGLELTLPAGARLSGTVTDALTHHPLAGARVFAESTAYDEKSDTPAALADAEGRFELAGLTQMQLPGPDGKPRRSFELHAEARDHAPLAPGKYELAEPAADRFTTNLELVPINCELNGVVNVAVDGAAAPISLVALIDESGQYQVAPTKEGGAFHFEHVSAGRALLWAWPTAQTATPVAEPLFARDGVQLQPGANSTVLWLEPIAGTEIAGRALAEPGAEDLHPTLLLRRGIARGKLHVSYEERTFELGTDGSFSARDLVPGVYQAELRFGPQQALALAEPARAEVEVEVGVKSRPLELRYARPLRLAGKIEAPGLDPKQATIELARAGTDSWTSVAPHPDGTFEIGGLWPATWRLRLRTQAGIGPEIEAGPRSAALVLVPKR